MPSNEGEQTPVTTGLPEQRGVMDHAAALIGGALGGLAFAPFGWWPLAFLSPAVLFYLLARRPGAGYRAVAYLWGLGWYTGGGYWLYHSIAFYGGGMAAALVFVVVLALLFALIPVVAVWLWQRVRPHNDALALLVALPLAWTLVEWIRSWLFTGTTWVQLGYSQTDSWLAGYAPLIGSLGISLLVAVGAGALAWAAIHPRGRRVVVAAAFVAVFAGGGALQFAPWTTAAEAPVRAALVQGNMPQDRKWDPEYRDVTLDRYRRFTEAHWDKDVIVWPETAVPMYYHQALNDYLSPLGAEAQARGTDLFLGIPSWDRESGNVYNSVLTLGSQVDFYHKRHLVPFGEYVPLRDYLGGLLDVFGAPLGDFTPGPSGAPLRAGDHWVGVSICYEITFPGLVADALPEAGYLVTVSNDGWFGDTTGPHQHLQKARMRAIEFRRPILRSTNTGITAAIDEHGRVTHRAPQFEPLALEAEIVPQQGATPYLLWLDWPVVGVAIGGLIAFAGLRRFRPAE